MPSSGSISQKPVLTSRNSPIARPQPHATAQMEPEKPGAPRTRREGSGGMDNGRRRKTRVGTGPGCAPGPGHRVPRKQILPQGARAQR